MKTFVVHLRGGSSPRCGQTGSVVYVAERTGEEWRHWKFSEVTCEKCRASYLGRRIRRSRRA